MDDIDKTMAPQRKNVFSADDDVMTVPGKRDRKPDGRFQVGDLIMNRYKVLAELGQGGMGVVYKCFDEDAGIEVALKALPPDLSHNTIEMEDIKENFQLVHNLHHPNIASYNTLEKDKSNGCYYLIMECCEGEDLRRWIKRKRKENELELEEVLPIVEQIASALDYAHGMKIMHRDIKPGNIMIDQFNKIKILDFGLAAQIRTSMTRVSMAYHGTSGTGSYMAPEQWEGRIQDARADQYALAVLTYEMLSGHAPFESSDAAVLREAVLKSKVVSLENIPKYADAAIQRALSKGAADRFESCSAFAAALCGGRNKTEKVQPNSPLFKWGAIGRLLALPSFRQQMISFMWMAVLIAVLLFGAVLGLRVSHGEPTYMQLIHALLVGGLMVICCFSVLSQQMTRFFKWTAALLIGGTLLTFGGIALYEYQELQARLKRYNAERAAEEKRLLAEKAAKKAAEEKRLLAEKAAEEKRLLAEKKYPRELLAPLDEKVHLLAVDCNGIKIDMVRIRWGRDYWIGKFEVTQAQYEVLMGKSPSFYKGSNRPVENVSWNDAKDFCNKLNERYAGKLPTGYKFDLPTAYQWEYACRAGTSSELNNGTDLTYTISASLKGERCSNLDKVGWYIKNSGADGTQNVGQKKPNAWGVYDMHGNVWELCNSWFANRYGGPVSGPVGSALDSDRVCRGGSWASPANRCRSADLLRVAPDHRSRFIGFRLALVPVQ